MTENIVGYVLVSQVHQEVRIRCTNCGPRLMDLCAQPVRPKCRAACVHNSALLAEHPECQEWERAFEAWVKAHYRSEPNGGTRLGPLHYFKECRRLSRPTHSRGDARVIAVDADTANDLRLPICEQCQAKMASFEPKPDERTVLEVGL